MWPYGRHAGSSICQIRSVAEQEENQAMKKTSRDVKLFLLRLLRARKNSREKFSRVRDKGGAKIYVFFPIVILESFGGKTRT